MTQYCHDMAVKRLAIDTVRFVRGYNLIDIIVSQGQLRVKHYLDMSKYDHRNSRIV